MTEKILRFSEREAFRAWLQDNHAQEESVWLEFLKGAARTFTHNQALEEALCYGWIDSIIKKVDEDWYRVKFSRRRPGSSWSQRNKRIADELICAGRMAPPGLEMIRAAKESGEWDKQPEAFSTERVMELERELATVPGARDRFRTATPARRKLLARYYFAAKSEQARARRLARIADSLRTGKPIM